MDPPASPARWDWAIQLRHRNKRDGNQSGIIQHDWHRLTFQLYFKYLPTSNLPNHCMNVWFIYILCMALLCFGSLDGCNAHRCMADLSFWIPTVRTVVVSQDPGCMQHADLRLATWDNLSDKTPTKSTPYLANWPIFFGFLMFFWFG